MTDFGEVTIDIEAMIEEMAEEALYRLDQMVKVGNAKQRRRMAGWEFLQKAALADSSVIMTYDEQRQLVDRWLTKMRGHAIDHE